MMASAKRWMRRRPWAWALLAALAAAAALCALSCIFPDLAFAADGDAGGEDGGGGFLEGIFDAITGLNPVEAIITFVTDLLVDLSVFSFNTSMDFMKLASTDLVGQPFDQLFGIGGTGIFEFVKTINDSFVTSVGYTFLAIVMLVKLAQLGQRMDGNGTLPAVKEVFLLIVWYAVLLFLVNNSFEICQAVYAVSNALVSMINSAAPVQSASDIYELTEDVLGGIGSLPALIVLAVVMFIFLILCFVAQIIMQFVVWGRALQIYAYAAFSPIALPFLGNDETKPWAMGFIKNFVSICVAGAIIAFLLLCFPFIFQIALIDLGDGTFSNLLNVVAWVLRCAAFYIVMIYALVKSGSWARDLLGG